MEKQKDNIPLVTIGIAVYNGSEYIQQTLASIVAQTYRNIELVIVDDGSDDNSYDLCAKWLSSSQYPVSLIRNASNLGLPKTCNIILNRTRGKYLQMFGQDDIMLPLKIENDVALFEKQNDNVALIYSDLTLINEKGEEFGNGYFERIGFSGLQGEAVFIGLIDKNFVPAPAVMVRTDVIKKSGGFDESLLFEDWDMWLRLAKQYEFIFSQCKNVCYRIHNRSMMANRNHEQTILRNRANMKMFEKHLGTTEKYDEALYKKLKNLAVYSYFIGDTDSGKILGNYLKKRFDAKVWLYRKMAALGIKHTSAWFKKSG